MNFNRFYRITTAFIFVICGSGLIPMSAYAMDADRDSVAPPYELTSTVASERQEAVEELDHLDPRAAEIFRQAIEADQNKREEKLLAEPRAKARAELERHHKKIQTKSVKADKKAMNAALDEILSFMEECRERWCLYQGGKSLQKLLSIHQEYSQFGDAERLRKLDDLKKEVQSQLNVMRRLPKTDQPIEIPETALMADGVNDAINGALHKFSRHSLRFFAHIP